ncbi:MAG: cadmium-translocating P-type ATPase [Nitrospinae bacterium]|nr:cadmium-translocating P-type ATPase [Nitrospinota bacterium]
MTPPGPGACFHCGLPLPAGGGASASIGGAERLFCCNGCRSVCGAIYDAGLDGFYRRMADGTVLSPPPPPPRGMDAYDVEDVRREFVTEHGGRTEVVLLVEGIHCAACAWLIEHAVGKAAGAAAAEVNLAKRRVKVGWDGSKARLSEILGLLARVGYAAVPYTPRRAEESARRIARQSLFRLGFAGFAAMNMMWMSIALWTGAAGGEYRDFFRRLELALALPALLYSGWPFLRGFYYSARGRHLSMDVPIAVGALAVFCYSAYVTLVSPDSGETYFDTLAVFLFVILIGRHLEASSRNKAADATGRMLELQPKFAALLRGDAEEKVSVRALRVGDPVLVRPGERLPVDGLVLDGSGEVDEAIITGEARPVPKSPGSSVTAGTMNMNGALTVRMEKSLSDTSLVRMVRLMEEAQATKAPIQRIADRVVPYFVAATLSAAALTFILWYGQGLERAMLTAASVLIITCPCALGLATPMAMAAAGGEAARHGVIIKNGRALETLARVDHVVFDKTGALTNGSMAVSRIVPADGFEERFLLGHAGAVERLSEHSLARAIVLAAENVGASANGAVVSGFRNFPGRGVSGTVDGAAVLVGNMAFMRERGVSAAGRDENPSVTTVYCAVGGDLAGSFEVGDALRPDAAPTVDALRLEGKTLTMLTGDTKNAAEAVAKAAGGMAVMAGMKPEDKYSAIGEFRKRGETVAMVGDGVNDAPALVHADVGIAVGQGADVSVENADVVLLGNRLLPILAAIRLSRTTITVIKQNIRVSLAYNALMVPLAMAGLITPVLAAVAMPVSSLLVIANASRIRVE